MSYNQDRTKQETVDGREAHLDTTRRVAAIMAEANERLVKLQSDSAHVAFADNSRRLKALLNTTDPGAAHVEWAGLYEVNMRRVLDVTRTCFEILPQAQAEMAKLLGEPFGSYHKETQPYLDQFTKAVTDQRDAAAIAMRDFLAKVMQSVIKQQAAKKDAVAQVT